MEVVRRFNHWRPRRLGKVARVLILGFLLSGVSAAGTIDVTNLNDSGAGSLRQAILNANSAAGADDIIFASSLSGRVELLSPLPQLSESATLQGPGEARVTIDSNGLGRVLDLGGGSTTTHTISGLTLTGGSLFGSDGAGILVRADVDLQLVNVRLLGNTATNASGGGLKAESGTSVSMLRCLVADNSAYAGAGIFALGTVSLDRSAVVDNSAILQGGGLAGLDVDVDESTIARNEAPGGEFTIGEGGGIFVFDGGQVSLAQATITENEADSGPGVFLLNSAMATTVEASIIAGNRHDGSGLESNCNVDLGITDAHNLSSDSTCGFTGTSDLENTDALLGPLLAAGGATPTVVPLPGSPAIDGASGVCKAYDQRDFPRPVDGDGVGGAACDIGAAEFTPDQDLAIFVDGFESGNVSSWSAAVP